MNYSSGDALYTEARRIRDEAFGTRITYSPKVFIPLTKLCRDKCGYCTFAEPPARVESPFMSIGEVLKVAKQGARAGCHEALFTLGERPELRYPAAAEWLAEHGYESTVHYVRAAAEAVLRETGLLPHANAGALYSNELELLREVSPSQGMMIESLRDDLDCHAGAPDKEPERRLATLEAAGEHQIPFTTGILVGIGEDRDDRIAALEAIRDSHLRHGHVQEVIVQNFLPKTGTRMRNDPSCPTEAHLDAIALARVILPPEVTVQAPPNLTEDVRGLLDAGIDDLGGISPLTIDHVNPERPWPQLDALAAELALDGFTLAPRLTAHPRYVADLHRWFDESLHFPIMDRSDAEGLGRDDPGAVFPERTMENANVTDGAEVLLIGDRSTAWYSGADTVPITLLPAQGSAKGRIREVLEGAEADQELGVEEIAALFSARGSEVAAVANLADRLRADVNGETVTYVANRNINYTNVCTFKCQFCGFSKGPLSLNLRGAPYLLTLDDIAQRVVEAREMGATEVCLQGGIHPDFDGDYYIDVIDAVHQAAPDIHIHGFTALEVTEGAKRLDEPLETYLARLRDAGLKSLPGTAAEILDDEIREILCPDKVNTEEWLEAHRLAHRVGLTSNVTIMFGAVENPIHWARHIVATRELQKETGGFTEFVTLPFVHMASPIYLRRRSRRGPTFRETLLMHSVARIAYHGQIDNIQASWPKIGLDGVVQLLHSGVNDLGGTLIDENISRAAGASHGTALTAHDFQEAIAPLGRTLRQRNTRYELVDNLDEVNNHPEGQFAIR